ncbi:coproporphyrinogen III oxidase [Paenibacillus chartarius]|uniref:Coproporphyrinogen III oxidase n=1 Tax=Paenibacillus chartarius TaxID=747481 RepID=A0ABV6DIW2_9BACL
MNIGLSRVGLENISSEIFHLHKLFFENATLVESEDDNVKLNYKWLVYIHEDRQKVAVRVKLEKLGGDAAEAWERSAELKIGTAADGRKRAFRKAVCSAMLQALQDATGLEQPWGILTGVRPTKLMHNLLQKHDRSEAKRIVMEEYLVTEKKAELLTDIAERQLKVIPDLFALDREVSIYIGIPFCPTKCAYCTFPAYDIRGNNGSVASFLEGLHYEIRETGRWLREAGLDVTTIYWGGGTPTSIEAHEMDALFETIRESFPDLSKVRELTVEAGRPDTITPDKIDVMKKWNVDRISINPQSFTQETLDAIGRHHTVKETVEKFKLARDMGMNNINMDLIIGLPNEGMAELELSLAETAKLLPESLTVHTLSFKRASKMTKNRDEYEVAERDEIGDMMARATAWTEEHGYVPYYLYRQKNILGNLENIGYALEGRESLYNILMMEERQTVIGLGCGAVSKVLFPRAAGSEEETDGQAPQRIERFPNPKEPSVYNSAYKEYVDKKLKLLGEAYGTGAETLTEV